MAKPNKKESQYIMSIAEKIKVSVSLLGVAALTVVAYWAQSPATPVSGDTFQANLIAAEDGTNADTANETASSEPEKTDSNTATETSASAPSKDLLDLLGIDKEKTVAIADDETAKEEPSNKTLPGTKDSSAGPQEAEESLRKLLGEQLPTETAQPTTHSAAESLEAPVSRFESKPTMSSDITIGADGIPQVDLTGTTIGRSVTDINSPSSTKKTDTALPGTGGPIAIPVLIGIAGAAFLQRKKRKN